MNKIKLIIVSFVILFAFSACADSLDINVDPDSVDPSALPLNSQFPSGLTGVATAQGSYYAIIGGLWSQFYTQSAVANQYKSIDDYSIGTNDYNGAWAAMYDALLDVRSVKSKANAGGNWNYYLMSTVIEAYGFQVLTDFYGAVPFNEALNSSILNPVYDEPSVIYDQLVINLQDALSKDLSTSAGVTPGSDDFLFSGNMDRWKEFANTLLLKIYLRQTNSRPTVAQNASTMLSSSFLTSDAAITQYIDEANKSNPLYESNVRQLNVATNLRTSTTLHSYLSDNADPRVNKYYTSGPSQDQGDYNNAAGANVGVVIMTATDPVYYISAAESYFLQAEADLRYNSGANAKSLYDLGVTAAFNDFGEDASSFIAPSGAYEYPAAGSMDDKLKAIITQKWISFFPGKGYEAFFEQTRTNIPAISTVAQSDVSYVSGEFAYSVNGTTSGQFPKRIVYPQSESQTNSNFPGLQTITTNNWYQ